MTSIIDNHLGKRIAEARQRAGMIARAVAEELELPLSTYQAMERGERRISALVMAKVSRIYGLPVGWFYQGLPGQSSFDRSVKGSSI